MNNIERVKHYSEIDTEAPFDSNCDNATDALVIAPKSWPDAGKIEIEWACARYRPELPLVFNDISFVVHAREKVGVCGRTGESSTCPYLI